MFCGKLAGSQKPTMFFMVPPLSAINKYVHKVHANLSYKGKQNNDKTSKEENFY